MIGVVGDGEAADRVGERLAGAGVEVARGPADEVVAAGPDAVVAVGEAALAAVVAAGYDGAVLPVDAGPGVDAVAPGAAPDAAERLVAGDVVSTERPLLAVDVAGERVGRALLDVLLVRSEPGRISEFGVAVDGRRRRFRADGVVAATPAGSHGYAHAAGGPRLAAGVDAVAVVPVAPFALGADAWVVDPAPGVELAVERDEGAVAVLLDGREVRTLAGRSTVALAPAGSLALVRPAGD